MDLESVKRYLEKGGETASTVNKFPLRFMEPLIMGSLRVDLIEPGRVICSMKIPPRLLNSGNSLHGGATAALVDVVGSAAIPASGHPGLTGVSVEINVSYLDAAYVDVCTSLYSPLISFSITQLCLISIIMSLNSILNCGCSINEHLYCCKIC
jgi:acyl-coenzyme A thioesterase 13